ncbi:MAG: hypothetical protein RXR32_00100 [Candidatus Micrarchaeota archaeon]
MRTKEKGEFMKDFGSLFFKEKQVKAFLLMASTNNQQEWNISNLAKSSGMTYVHLSRFINECEKTGLVESTRHGRIKGIKLTSKGIEVANHLSSISNSLGKEKAEHAEAEKEAEPKQPQQ